MPSSSFASRLPQRGDATGKQPGCESPCSPDVGPGAYDPRPGIGNPAYTPWLRDPMRMGSQFISRTQNRPTPAAITGKVNLTITPKHIRTVYGASPSSRGHKWPNGERTPPHFHVPFRAYPCEGGEPRGRSIGLDTFYELDDTGATPVALFGTLTINMERTARVYASSFNSKQPSRPRAGSGSSAGPLGPGSYNLRRDGIDLKEPKRPSSAFIPQGRGRYVNVGGPNGDGGLWPEDIPNHNIKRRKQRPKSART